MVTAPPRGVTQTHASSQGARYDCPKMDFACQLPDTVAYCEAAMPLAKLRAPLSALMYESVLIAVAPRREVVNTVVGLFAGGQKAATLTLKSGQGRAEKTVGVRKGNIGHGISLLNAIDVQIGSAERSGHVVISGNGKSGIELGWCTRPSILNAIVGLSDPSGESKHSSRVPGPRAPRPPSSLVPVL